MRRNFRIVVKHARCHTSSRSPSRARTGGDARSKIQSERWPSGEKLISVKISIDADSSVRVRDRAPRSRAEKISLARRLIGSRARPARASIAARGACPIRRDRRATRHRATHARAPSVVESVRARGFGLLSPMGVCVATAPSASACSQSARERSRARVSTSRGDRRRPRVVARAGFSPNESHDESEQRTSARGAKALVERLASAFLSSPRRRSAATRAWLVDEVSDAREAGARRIKATEMEVSDDRALRSNGTTRGLELYDKLRAHERAVVVARLLRPTVLTFADQGLAYVDAVALATDEPGCDGIDERDLANYCFSCPLRSMGASTDEDVLTSMCGFECAIRSRISSRADARATYTAALYSTKAGRSEEFLITSIGDSHVTRRAQFSRELRERLGVESSP